MKIFRSRYISAISSMAIMADLPDNVLFRVLSDRVHLTNLMPFLNDTNQKNVFAQLDWVLADEDWRQWKVTNGY